MLVRDLGTVSFGPDVRRGAADWQGEGETVGGIVVMRYGMNALNVIDGVKAKFKEIAPSLPAGVEIVTGYDRSWLINQSIHTLKRDLIVEAIIVSFVSIAFLFHFRSALVPILTLPIAVLAAFIPMYYLHVSSNIMSLGGLALAVGVLIDAAIVMVENGYRHLAERSRCARRRRSDGASWLARRSRWARRSSTRSSSSWSRFCRCFCSKRRKAACSGRWPGPRRWLSSFPRCSPSRWFRRSCRSACAESCAPNRQNPAARITQAIYLPVLRWCLKHWKLVIALNLAFLAATIPLYFRLGSQFMPALYEGSALYMPSALPGISITQAVSLMQEQDRIIRSFPEVATVFGTVGRSDSATDNAPLDMYDTTIMLKPRDQWRPGMTYEKLIHEMDEKLQFPGLTNTWTMPVAEPARHGADRHQDRRSASRFRAPIWRTSRISARRCSRFSPPCRRPTPSLRSAFRRASISTWK